MLQASWADYLRIAFYFVAMLFFYRDFLREDKVANRMGVAILSFVFLLDSFGIVEYVVQHHHFPIYTAAQATILFSWLLIAVSLIVSWLFRIDYFVFLLTLFGFAFSFFDVVIHRHATTLHVVQRSDLLLLHIATALLSYLAFSVGMIFSILYFLQAFSLREKRFESGPFLRLPPLFTLERYSFRSALIGEILLGLTIVYGEIWFAMLTGHWLDEDKKSIMSFLLFWYYALFLFLRSKGWISARTAAVLQWIGYLGIVINFFVVSLVVSKYHQW